MSLKRYEVTLYGVVRVKSQPVEAASPEEAVELAEQRVDVARVCNHPTQALNYGALYATYADDTLGCLVDEIDDHGDVVAETYIASGTAGLYQQHPSVPEDAYETPAPAGGPLPADEGDALNEAAAREGWSARVMLDVALEYIRNQQDPDAFREHVERQIASDDELAPL